MALSTGKRIGKLAQKNEERRAKHRDGRLRALYLLLAVPLTFIALIYIHAYSKRAFIPFTHHLLIGLVSGVLLSLPLLKILLRSILLMILLLGWVSSSLFLLINQAYADVKPIEKIKRPVIRKWAPYKRTGASIDIRYNGNTENFTIDENQLNSANYVTLTVKQGYFGYTFIADYKITSE